MTSGDPEAIALSVVIVNWNTRGLLARCLESVGIDLGFMVSTCGELLTDCPPIGTEVFVVDNASTDGSADMVRERFPWVELIESRENLGFARANNQAIRQARGRYVLLLNSDTEVRPGALLHLVNIMERHPRAGAVGPRMLNPDGSLQNSYGPLPSVLSEILGPYSLDPLTKPWGKIGIRFTAKELDKSDCRVVDRVSFACTLISRAALQQVGLLDERFVFYSEDYDWFKRLKDAQQPVLFCPEAQVVHHWGASSRQNSDWAVSQLYRSKRLYYAKHYGPAAERVLRVGLSIRFALKLFLALIASPVQKRVSTRDIHLNQRLIREMARAL